MCGQGLEEVSRTEIGKKIKEGMEEAAKTAKTSAESVSKSGEMLGKTGAFRAISQVWSHCAHYGADVFPCFPGGKLHFFWLLSLINTVKIIYNK